MFFYRNNSLAAASLSEGCFRLLKQISQVICHDSSCLVCLCCEPNTWPFFGGGNWANDPHVSWQFSSISLCEGISILFFLVHKMSEVLRHRRHEPTQTLPGFLKYLQMAASCSFTFSWSSAWKANFLKVLNCSRKIGELLFDIIVNLSGSECFSSSYTRGRQPPRQAFHFQWITHQQKLEVCYFSCSVLKSCTPV